MLAAALARQTYGLLFGLIEVRGQRGLSQADVADVLGVSQQAVSKFEQMDSDPRLSTVRKYALAVGAQFSIAVGPHDFTQLPASLETAANTCGSALPLAVAAAGVATAPAAVQSHNVDLAMLVRAAA